MSWSESARLLHFWVRAFDRRVNQMRPKKKKKKRIVDAGETVKTPKVKKPPSE